jgi:hypothetical protein
MPRPATTLAAAALTAFAVGAAIVPANAEAVVYETKNVRATTPEGGVEYASLDIPTGYDRDRINRHAVAFVEQHGAGRVISLDLDPEADTLRKIKQERRAMEEKYGDSYHQFAFKVNGRDAKVRVKWVYTFSEDGTEDTEPYVNVYLVGGNQLRVVGKVSEREQVNNIRNHVVGSLVFPG